MKYRLICWATAVLWICPAQQDPAALQRRMTEVRGKLERNEPLSDDEKNFVQRMREQFAREHPPRETTGLIPLPELGKGTYQGEQGGLYPGGSNTPPPAHAKAGLNLARRIVPLDADGKPSKEGRIVMISTGMSNTTMESQAFQQALAGASGIHPRFLFVDCAQGGQTAAVTARPASNYWKVADERLDKVGTTPKQVQVTWLKQANGMPSAPFPQEARKLYTDILETLHVLKQKYPNLKVAYLSNRIYAGYASTPLNPEPHAYETAFAVKWLIADQIAGKPDLNYDPAKGEVKAPWLAWGPYLWADGVKASASGLTWSREEVAQDGTHPSNTGTVKVAKLLLDFLRNDASAKPWFLGM